MGEEVGDEGGEDGLEVLEGCWHGCGVWWMLGGWCDGCGVGEGAIGSLGVVELTVEVVRWVMGANGFVYGRESVCKSNHLSFDVADGAVLQPQAVS